MIAFLGEISRFAPPSADNAGFISSGRGGGKVQPTRPPPQESELPQLAHPLKANLKAKLEYVASRRGQLPR